MLVNATFFYHLYLDLWILQKNGLIEYTISEPVFAINLNSSRVTLECHPRSLVHFTKAIAIQVFEYFERIQKANMNRVYDMWRVGMKIHANIGNERDENCDYNEKQSFNRLLLSHHMDRDSHLQNDSYCVDDIRIPLISKPSSNSTMKFFPLHEQSELTLDVTRLHQDVLLLSEDSRISFIVERIKDCCPNDFEASAYNSPDNCNKVDENDELNLKALYICRVFHGLSSNLLPSAEWREACAQWSKYTQVHFEHLHEFIVETLR